MVGLLGSRWEDVLSGSDRGSAGRYAVYCGMDVGRSEHHACALDPDGNRLRPGAAQRPGRPGGAATPAPFYGSST